MIDAGGATNVLRVGVFGDFPEPGGRAVGMVGSPTAVVATRCWGLPGRGLAAAAGLPISFMVSDCIFFGLHSGAASVRFLSLAQAGRFTDGGAQLRLCSMYNVKLTGTLR